MSQTRMSGSNSLVLWFEDHPPHSVDLIVNWGQNYFVAVFFVAVFKVDMFTLPPVTWAPVFDLWNNFRLKEFDLFIYWMRLGHLYVCVLWVNYLVIALRHFGLSQSRVLLSSALGFALPFGSVFRIKISGCLGEPVLLGLLIQEHILSF